jgi:hypothetical protein
VPTNAREALAVPPTARGFLTRGTSGWLGLN